MTDTSTAVDAPAMAVAAAAPAPANPWWRPPMRDVLAVCSTLLIAIGYLAPIFNPEVKLDPDLKGAILLQWGLVMGYYFGTSKTSVAKDKVIAGAIAGSGQ